jgi:RNA polymerase sigma-70 factor (ECF subfamily)
VRAEPAALEASVLRDFARVYEEHFEFVWRSLRLLGVHHDALDDVSQEVFSAVARQLGRFEGRSSLRTWVFGITQNVASNHRRMRQRKLERLMPLPGQLASQEPSPQAHTEGREAADAVLSFCEGLDEGRRTVFVLGLLEGTPAPEIAALLGIPVNTVYSRVSALRGALERHLNEREVER